MKKILLSLAVVAAVAAVVVGGTIAYFSDTETSVGNTFAAGSLDLAVDGQNPLTSHYALSNLKPGDTMSDDVTLANVGTVNASKVTVKIANVVESEGDNSSEAETNKTDPGDLSANMVFTVTDGTHVYTGPLSDFATAKDLNGILAGGNYNVTVSYSIPGTVGNDIQGDNVTFDVVVELVQ